MVTERIEISFSGLGSIAALVGGFQIPGKTLLVIKSLSKSFRRGKVKGKDDAVNVNTFNFMVCFETQASDCEVDPTACGLKILP